MNFIGVGAQKSGTSWVYACLYEHPQICAPVKEIHFFSRPRYEQGIESYENNFRNCKDGQLSGEFSTSYLYSEEAPARIYNHYPNAKIIAIIRNPRQRAYSQYRNSIKSGEIDKGTSFEAYAKEEASVIAQGRYYEQLKRYYDMFPADQILVMIYEDSKKDPATFIKKIYQFLGVDDSFVPSLLNTEVNIARTPKNIKLERVMHYIAEKLRKLGLDQLVWQIKKSGLPDLIRKTNTETVTEVVDIDAVVSKEYFIDDVVKLESLLGRTVGHEWGIR